MRIKTIDEIISAVQTMDCNAPDSLIEEIVRALNELKPETPTEKDEP